MCDSRGTLRGIMLRLTYKIIKWSLTTFSAVAGIAGATGSDRLAWLLMLIPELSNRWVYASFLVYFGIMVGWELKTFIAQKSAGAVVEKPEWGCYKLIRYLRHCHDFSTIPKGEKKFLIPIANDVEDKLALGYLKSWGRRSPNHTPEEIDSAYCRAGRFNF